MVQLYSDRISPVPPYSFHLYISSLTGLSPSMVMIPIMFYSLYIDFRAFPRSLATTCGITNCSPFLQVLRCFSSLGFLCLRNHISSKCGVSPFGHIRVKGYLAPHRILSQPYHVLHRSLKPRHPPYTLCSRRERCMPPKGDHIVHYVNAVHRCTIF